MRRLSLPDSDATTENGGRRCAPSAGRNFAPICAVHDAVLPARGRALELASGTGQHVAGFARRYPGLHWQPSDVNDAHFVSIRAWAAGDEGAAPPNLADPLVLDACAPGWGAALGPFDAVCLTNLLHLISDAEAATLLAEAAAALAPGGVFCLYGPFRRGGALVTEGDVAFDASLRAQDPEIGYKDIAWVEERLAQAGLTRDRLVGMPAGNLMLVTRRPRGV